MNLGAEDKDKILRYGVIGGAVLIVAIYGYLQLRTPDAPASPLPVAVVTVAKPPVKTASSSATGAPVSAGVVTKAAAAENSANKVGTTAAQYDPTLHMQAMLVTERLVYSGAGRNIFSSASAPPPVVIPRATAPVRTTGVVLPVFTGPPVPPPPPAIDLKFFGTETRADGSREAFLLHGDDVFLATPGNIVLRRYKVGAISANSVEVEDLTNNNKQSLPLQKN